MKKISPARGIDPKFFLSKTISRAIILFMAAFCQLSAQAVEVGQAAPDFDLPGRTSAINLNDYKGKLVYLDFWASWCGPCKQSFPWMNEMQARYGAKGLRVVSINVDQKPDDAKNFLSTNAARFEVAFDQAGKTPRAYAVKGMPTSVLISADGKVLMVHNGFKDTQRGDLERQIRAALHLKDNE